MSLKKASWVIVVFVALLVSACGTTDSNDPLKPPSIRRDPDVHVTRAPTEVALDTPTAEPSASPTVTPQIFQPSDWSAADEEQFLMDEIERLLNRIESKLEQIDTNP